VKGCEARCLLQYETRCKDIMTQRQGKLLTETYIKRSRQRYALLQLYV